MNGFDKLFNVVVENLWIVAILLGVLGLWMAKK